MFSLQEKQMISQKVEELLLSLNHPEMPNEKPKFELHVDGKENWSWADIKPNWVFNGIEPITTKWNENARDLMSK